VIDARTLGGHLARAAWLAVRSFLGTLALLTAAGITLAAASGYALWDRPAYALIAAGIALLEGVGAGAVLGAKRAVVVALAYALGKLRLGRALVQLVFDHLLGDLEGQEPGERGGLVVRQLERLPLARAERLLGRAVRAAAGEARTGGWLRRAIRARLLALVGKYTLTRFRDEGARHGGVDLLRVKEELEGQIDVALVNKVRGGLRLWTVLVIVGLPVVVAAQTYVAMALLK
jgi:hypothetical protein